ncbi:DUF1513 domain-containing protein [Rhodoferax sp.]|uniref:DUF1513 domain-containing protein n=1 Tax=Rhodoferax sp. TaxID=50421 RepID=UPI0025F5AB58|nr:DUF1513 domain-containing protein [Rhodoferax sp.]
MINSNLRRRDWLALAAASMALPANATSAPGLLTSWVIDDQAWAGVWQLGSTSRGVALPKRAHEVQMLHAALGHPGQALAVARRPGEYLLRFDTRSARAVLWHDIEDDRVLCGHASYALDGSALYTTETSTDTGAGFIAVRDPVSLEKIREFSSGGLDPHMVLVEPDGTLLVANGGLLNLPETGRTKLNLKQMDSSIARLDAATGTLRQAWRASDPYLSLRHLARAPNGTVAIAMQAEHADAAARRSAPLLALLDANGLRTIALPEPLALGGYGGDVAFVPGRNSPADDRFVVSATRAGQLAWWSAQGGDPRQLALPEAGALAAYGPDWLASGAQGGVRGEVATRRLDRLLADVHWDNHGKWLV